MLRIHVPCCGERDYTEFRYGGDASKRAAGARRGGIEGVARVCLPVRQSQGPHREFWQHVQGCRQWLVLERNTATNEVGGSCAARRERRPANDDA